MNKKFSTVSSLLPVILVMIIGLGCGGGASDQSTNTRPTGTAPESTPQPASAAETDIAGTYAATGMNAGGGDAYKADLTITKRDDVHQFTWQSGPNKYDGVGVRTDDSIAVAFTEGTDGKGCGVVLYKIGDDGSLNGKAGYWGVNKSESETAKRSGGTQFEGAYDITGTSPDGKAYTGKLDITRSGEGYDFNWNAGGLTKGFGVREGNKAAVGFGGNQCGFVLYEVKSDGTLSGKWGGKGVKTFGTETLIKKS